MDENLTVADLLSQLEDCDPDAEVRLAHQPEWPLQFTLDGIATEQDLDEESRPDHGSPGTTAAPDTDTRPEAAVVWLVAGGHPAGDSPYAPARLWQHARRD